MVNYVRPRKFSSFISIDSHSWSIACRSSTDRIDCCLCLAALNNEVFDLAFTENMETDGDERPLTALTLRLLALVFILC